MGGQDSPLYVRLKLTTSQAPLQLDVPKFAILLFSMVEARSGFHVVETGRDEIHCQGITQKYGSVAA